MKKRLLMGLVFVSVAALSLAACGSDNTTKAPTTTKVQATTKASTEPKTLKNIQIYLTKENHENILLKEFKAYEGDEVTLELPISSDYVKVKGWKAIDNHVLNTDQKYTFKVLDTDLYFYVDYEAGEKLAGYDILYDGKGVSILKADSNIPNNVVLLDCITSIGEEAFSECRDLTSITIPNSVKSIDKYAFRGCFDLIEVINKSSLQIETGSTENGYVAYYAKQVITDVADSKLSIVDDFVIFDNILVNYLGDSSEITIPEGITSIGDYVFYNYKDLTSITIPEGVTIIGTNAFNGCSNLTNITIPSTVVSIDDFAFAYCVKLTSITIPESVTIIGANAFNGCSRLTSITIPEGVTSIGDSAFAYCKNITSITIPEGVTKIDSYAFFGWENLTSVTIPSTVAYIGEKAFSTCYKLVEVINKSSLQIEKGIKTNGHVAYYAKQVITDEADSKLSTVDGFVIYDNTTLVNYVGNESIITIPEGVTSIGDRAFEECNNLTSITLPNSVTSIGKGAFKSLYLEANIIIPNTVTSIGEDAFFGFSGKIYNEAIALDLYDNTGASKAVYVYTYSETEPAEEGYYFHYDTNGNIVEW